MSSRDGKRKQFPGSICVFNLNFTWWFSNNGLYCLIQGFCVVMLYEKWQFPCILLALHFKPHLDVDSLDDAGDDMEHLHFCVALRYLLQQLEEQPKYGLQVLEGGSWSLEIGWSMLPLITVVMALMKMYWPGGTALSETQNHQQVTMS